MLKLVLLPLSLNPLLPPATITCFHIEIRLPWIACRAKRFTRL